jgi:Bacterial sugar transferase
MVSKRSSGEARSPWVFAANVRPKAYGGPAPTGTSSKRATRAAGRGLDQPCDAHETVTGRKRETALIKCTQYFLSVQNRRRVLMGYGELPVIDIDVDPLDRVARTFKRTLDLSLSSIVFLLATIPLLLLVGALKIDSRGPIFYMQPRIGRNGRKFLR